MRNLLIITSIAWVLVGCATSRTGEGSRSAAKPPASDVVADTEVQYVIDGRNATRAEFEKLAPDRIAQIEVLKGSAAPARYGMIGRHGVILVTTRDPIAGRGDQQTAKFPADVLYFINGRAATQADVQGLAADAIENIEIIKGKSALVLYGPEARAGAILVTLKPKR